MRFLQPERKNKLSTGCRNQRIEELINPSWGINSLTQRRLTDGFLFSAVSLCEENLLCPSYQHFSLFSSLFRCLFYNERKRREKTCGRSWEKDFTLLLTNHDFGFTARLNEAIPKMIGYQAVNPLFLWLEGQRICLVIPSSSFVCCFFIRKKTSKDPKDKRRCDQRSGDRRLVF